MGRTGGRPGRGCSVVWLIAVIALSVRLVLLARLCLGGKRLKLSKEIPKEHETLEARVADANDTRFVFGHSVTLQEDGRLLVRYAPEGSPHCGCVCLPKAREPLPATYCYCCEGHVKHHLQIALGRKLAGVVRSSALSTGGSKPCTFLFTVQD